MKRLLRKWIDRLIYHGCEHTHTFVFDLPKEVAWYSFNRDLDIHQKMGPHGSLQILGCYLCGKIWCRDYEA